MTPQIDRYLKQWSFYKKSVITFLAINVFSVCTALVLGVNYFVIKRDIVKVQRETLHQVVQTDKALNKLENFVADLKSRTQFTIRSKADELRALGILADWQELKGLLNAADPELAESKQFDSAALVFTTEGFAHLQETRDRLRQARTTRLEALEQNLDRHTRQTSLLVLTGLLTLLFGILLPHFVLYLMGRTLNKIRLEVQQSALDFIARWNETRGAFGEDAFRSAEFWLQVLLLIGEESSRYSRHPALQLSGELAHLIRVELKKKNAGQTAA